MSSTVSRATRVADHRGVGVVVAVPREPRDGLDEVARGDGRIGHGAQRALLRPAGAGRWRSPSTKLAPTLAVVLLGQPGDVARRALDDAHELAVARRSRRTASPDEVAQLGDRVERGLRPAPPAASRPPGSPARSRCSTAATVSAIGGFGTGSVGRRLTGDDQVEQRLLALDVRVERAGGEPRPRARRRSSASAGTRAPRTPGPAAATTSSSCCASIGFPRGMPSSIE